MERTYRGILRMTGGGFAPPSVLFYDRSMTTPPPWYVLTGGPCAGKTTLLAELEKRGYKTVPEAARTYIDQERAKGRTLEEIRSDEGAFQHALIPMKVSAEQNASKDEVIFFDRGMHDSLVYFSYAGVSHHPELDEALTHLHYRKVFILDMLPYEKDDARTENYDTASQIHLDLKTAYQNAGMEVVEVPVMPVSARADFVLSHL